MCNLTTAETGEVYEVYHKIWETDVHVNNSFDFPYPTKQEFKALADEVWSRIEKVVVSKET